MIRGLTDHNRLPRIAKIRLGEKRSKGGGKEYPAALDHFSFVDCPEVAAVYGDKCKELFPVQFPISAIEEFFPTALKAYRKTGLFCKCEDGETAVRAHVGLAQEGPDQGKPLDIQGWTAIEANGDDPKDLAVGDLFEMPCPHTSCHFYERKLCNNNGRLFFVLPKVNDGGCYEIATTSTNGIVNIMSTLRFIDARARHAGLTGVAWLPFHLSLRPQKAVADGRPKLIYVLHLEFRGKLPDKAPTLALTAPEIGPDPTPDDIVKEGGEALDRELGATPAETEDPADMEDEIRKLCGELNMTQAQATLRIRKAKNENGGLSRLLDSLLADLEKTENGRSAGQTELPGEQPLNDPRELFGEMTDDERNESESDASRRRQRTAQAAAKGQRKEEAQRPAQSPQRGGRGGRQSKPVEPDLDF